MTILQAAKRLRQAWRDLLCAVFGHNFCAYDLDTDKCLHCDTERKARRNWS